MNDPYWPEYSILPARRRLEMVDEGDEIVGGGYDGDGGYDGGGGARVFEEYCDDHHDDNAECNVFRDDDNGDDKCNELETGYDDDNGDDEFAVNEEDDECNEFPVNEEDDECNELETGYDYDNEDCNGDEIVGLVKGDYIYHETVEPYQTLKKKIVKTVFGDEEEIAPPKINMRFSTYEEVHDYIFRYARQKGFGICRTASSSKRASKGSDIKVRRCGIWICECAGKPAPSKQYKDRSKLPKQIQSATAKARRSKKVGCPVEMYASVDEKGDWIIRRVMLDHQNHEPTPRKSRDVPVYRKRNLIEREKHLVRFIKNSSKAGISNSDIIKILAEDRDEEENLPCNSRDIQKMNREEVKLNLSGGDARAMVDYFNKLTTDNQNFFHMERYVEGGGLQDIVWVDARSRAAYEEFGDVVVFDATRYSLVNALLSRETAETYTWLFTTWLNCMSGKAPSAILTDQDAAMRRALKETMKGTTHRWCLWHILQKFPKYLNKHERYEDLKADLENVIYDSSDPVTYEKSWNDVIVHYGVKENDKYNDKYKWLEVMYNERHMWISAYTKDVFWAGMRTTQRSESYNHFSKGYVDRNTYLYQFVRSYLKAMAKKAMDEDKADRSDQRFVRQLATTFHVETLFRRIYTDSAYWLVQEEVRKICYTASEVSRIITCDTGTTIEYIFEDRKWIKPKNSRAAEIPT
ncbi:protein FAR1-RELATED SEQUENCE 8-like [Spinacia oleracea]|uniref:Protein FAR1-RELATED SEQUENCE 8-like n=1 Tax=Spinacia oleracea TaxID=3562 RepID=A0ABM3RS05_SPIOL|nr:protein FAR1-RELATED SEQUENCE 8-like [Spinacia oleracea]